MNTTAAPKTGSRCTMCVHAGKDMVQAGAYDEALIITVYDAGKSRNEETIREAVCVTYWC
jgi:hypothetical protein